MARVKETPTSAKRKGSSEDEYFRQKDDPYVLPPELNITIRDGFRFGVGFILAMLIFWAVVMVGIVIALSFGLV